MCLQLQSSSNIKIDSNSNIMFDKTLINDNSDIVYDFNDGYFYINTDGNYYVSWWFCGSSKSDVLSINLHTCMDDNFKSYIPFDCGQVHGIAILNVSNNHLRFSLVNNCDNDLFPTTNIDVKANICIYKIFSFAKHNFSYRQKQYLK